MILWGSVLIREREANRTRVPGLQYPGHQPGKGAAGCHARFLLVG